MGHPQMNLHRMPQKANPQQHQHNGQPSLTTEENGIVNRIAHSMMQRTSEDQLNAIRNLVPLEQRRVFQARGVDPAVVYFRTGAITKFLENKAKLAERTPPIPSSNNAPLPQQVRPPSQNTGPALSQQSSSQMFEPLVAGSMNQILGQQLEAMRSQEAGQVVVPASTGQIIPDSQRGNIRTAPQQPNVQLEGNLPGNQPSNSQYWSQNRNMQPSPHMRMSPQGLQFVHMPQGGLHSQPRMAPQHTSLPNINQTTSPKSQNAWPPQKPSPMTQSKEKELASPHQIAQQPAPVPLKQSNASLNRQSAIPLKMQDHFTNMPANMPVNSTTSVNEEQKKAILQRQMQIQIQQQRFLARQKQQNETLTKGSEPENVDANKVQTATQTSQPSHHISNTITANNNGIPQQPAPFTPGQAPQLTPQERAALSYTLNEEETRQMDNCNFPPSILNNSSGQYLSKLPSDLKSWGQLKSWAAQNEHALPPVTLHKLRNLQGMHYHSLVANSRRKTLNQTMNTQGLPQPSAPTAPMVPMQNHGLPLPVANPPQPVVNVAQSIPRPTVQDIQVFRAQFSERVVNLNDAEIEIILTRGRQEQLRNQQRAAQQPSLINNNSRNPNEQNVQPQFPPVVNQTSISLSPNLQRSQPDQNPRPSAATNAASKHNRQVQQLPAHGSTKGVKRNSDNDIVEVAARKDTLTKAQTSTEPRVNTSANNQEHSAGVYDRQRHLQAEHQRAVPTQSVNHDTKVSSFDQRRVEAQKSERDFRFNQILTEVNQNIPRRQPIQMDAHTRSLAVQQLAAAKEYFHRVEATLPKFFTLSGDEAFVKRVIQAVCCISIVRE